MDKKFLIILSVIFCSLLSACDSGQNYAPVTEIGSNEVLPTNGMHRVVHGESLYEIAWRYGLDYRYLAKRNNMHSPYTLYTGQLIYLRGNYPVSVTQVTMPVQKTLVRTTPTPVLQPTETEPHFTTAAWLRPAKGQVITYFSNRNKGIDIAGQLATPIYATAAGKVVYAGSGLRGYGKLIIIKHNNLYLSAYAHNKVILVQEGDWIRKGQKIAEMGNTGSDIVKLHFEIRRAGQPVNPLTLIAV